MSYLIAIKIEEKTEMFKFTTKETRDIFIEKLLFMNSITNTAPEYLLTTETKHEQAN